MTEPTQPRFDQELAKFARGELSAAEARELARTSLESPAWFEELTGTALAKSAVASVPIPMEPLRRPWWRSPMFLATASVIAIAVCVLAYLGRISQHRSEIARGTEPKPGARNALLKPTFTLSAGSSQPVLLAQDLQPAIPSASGQVFRGQAEVARPPRQIGSITLLEDGFATVNLGAVDGLSKATEVEVFRDRTLKGRAGALRITTVFREQARGEAADFKPLYIVRVSDSTHLQALIQRAEDLQSAGQLNQARQAASDASGWANMAQVSNAEKARAADLLARVDFQASDLQSAETHYRAALDLLSGATQTSVDDVSRIQNNLATIAMLRGDYERAQKALDQNAAVPASHILLADRLNNLGVLAESRGDRQQAESFYTQALDTLTANSVNERKVVEANLARLKGSH